MSILIRGVASTNSCDPMASPNDHKRIFITDKGAEEWPYGEEIVVTHLRGTPLAMELGVEE